MTASRSACARLASSKNRSRSLCSAVSSASRLALSCSAPGSPLSSLALATCSSSHSLLISSSLSEMFSMMCTFSGVAERAGVAGASASSVALCAPGVAGYRDLCWAFSLTPRSMLASSC